MKKILLKSLLAIIVLLGSTNASAYDFEVDGIYYDVASLSELTCMVARGSEKYEGDIVIPATVDYANRTLTVVGIDNEVFRDCSNLTGITIPNTISSIGNNMFNGCSKLERITIEDGETVLDFGYFGYNYYRLYYSNEEVVVDCPITLYLGRNLSYKTSSDYSYSPFANKNIKEVTIGNFVTEIGSYAFYDCNRLESVTIGNSVTEIGDDAFRGCSGLEKVIVKDIAAWCNISFSDYYSNPLYYAHHLYSDEETEIKDLVIPNSITEIGDYAFYNCRGLTTLYSFNAIPPSVGSSTFTNNQYMTLNVYVPEEALEAYQNAELWKNFWNLQGFDATGIENVKSDAINGNNIYYDLRGNRLDAPKKGLNIINGKKVMIK